MLFRSHYSRNLAFPQYFLTAPPVPSGLCFSFRFLFQLISHELLNALAFCRRVVRPVTFQKVDDAPYRQTSAKSHDQNFKNVDCLIEKFHIRFFPNRFIAVFLFIIAFQTKPKRKRARNFVHFLSSFRLRFGISFPYKMMIVRSFGFRVHYSVVVPLFKWDLVSFA